MKEYTIKVFEEIGASNAVSADAGEKIYNKICNLFDKDYVVNIDFSGITGLITAFLHSSIGKLYGRYSKEGFIKAHLNILNLKPEFNETLIKAITTAKIYYKNPKNLD